MPSRPLPRRPIQRAIHHHTPGLPSLNEISPSVEAGSCLLPRCGRFSDRVYKSANKAAVADIWTRLSTLSITRGTDGKPLPVAGLDGDLLDLAQRVLCDIDQLHAYDLAQYWKRHVFAYPRLTPMPAAASTSMIPGLAPVSTAPIIPATPAMSIIHPCASIDIWRDSNVLAITTEHQRLVVRLPPMEEPRKGMHVTVAMDGKESLPLLMPLQGTFVGLRVEEESMPMEVARNGTAEAASGGSLLISGSERSVEKARRAELMESAAGFVFDESMLPVFGAAASGKTADEAIVVDAPMDEDRGDRSRRVQHRRPKFKKRVRFANPIERRRVPAIESSTIAARLSPPSERCSTPPTRAPDLVDCFGCSMEIFDSSDEMEG